MIDEIIGVVKNTKEGQKNVERELDDHKELLNVLLLMNIASRCWNG